GHFLTLKGRTDFQVRWNGNQGMTITANDRTSTVRPEHLEWAWVALQSGILSADQFPGDDLRKAKSYLFAILAELPYVRV
ncbi:UNVERIFIED_CONTAM: hypothetical protein NY603_39465, partial [Bacteroidetes bacterium 56_B9]